MAIVEKDSNWLSFPGGGQHEIERVITVDVPRLDEEAPLGSNQAEGSRLTSRETELNPIVIRERRACLAGLDGSQVGPLIAIEIGNGKAESGFRERGGSAPNFRTGRASR